MRSNGHRQLRRAVREGGGGGKRGDVARGWRGGGQRRWLSEKVKVLKLHSRREWQVRDAHLFLNDKDSSAATASEIMGGGDVEGAAAAAAAGDDHLLPS